MLKHVLPHNLTDINPDAYHMGLATPVSLSCLGVCLTLLQVCIFRSAKGPVN